MSNTTFKRDEILLLLGAGASVEAGVPDSTNMVRLIEKAVSTDEGWGEFRGLYWYVRSAIHYADGLDGTVGSDVVFNIERLVNALDELRKKERHTLYPFVGAWNPKLLDVAGREFEYVRAFRREIVERLRREWLPLRHRETASYFEGLLRFQGEYGYPLRVFTLNYDLCVEDACGLQNVQRGFENREWDWRRFDETSDDPARLLLYKLHGSTDWKLAEGRVTYEDAPLGIPQDSAALIFGTSYKLQYVDPFLFLAYQLRRWTLDEARIVVSIGYGFGDEHINGILQQALRRNRKRKLLAVTGPSGEEEHERERARIIDVLEAEPAQVVVRSTGAKQFLDQELSIEYLASLFPPDESLIDEIPSDG